MTSWERLRAEHDANYDAMVAKDKAAAEKGTLLGRYLNIQIADGYAYYEITKVNKKSCRVRVIRNIGDDWVIPYIGEEGSVPMDYVQQVIRRRENHAKLFGRA
jgi:hypothetical protein